MLIENRKGNYTFIRGIGPFSAGVRAHPGFAISHARLQPFATLAQGYDLIERQLGALGRPLDALCGIQLRLPQPLSREGFDQFNRPYIERLRSWSLEIEGANPVTRTNVALEANPVPSPMLASFFYTVPANPGVATWVLSGVPEIASRDGAVKIVAPGDTSPEGLRQKTQCVLAILDHHVRELGLNWSEATTVNLYTVHDLHPLMASIVLPVIGAAQTGITWHHARPPVTGLDLEIDAWSVAREELVVTP